jgi:uncharacterized protein (DUF2236 family)
MSASPKPASGIERTCIRVSDYFATAERARVLSRVLESDPRDREARAAFVELRRNGFDLDAEYVLGFALGDCVEHASDGPDAAWTARLMDEATAFATVGLYAQAAETLHTLLRLDPKHEVARAWLHDLVARSARAPRRADETLRIEIG